MKKTLKRGIALLIALLMLLSAASCSWDTTWSLKLDDETLPIGVYIYYMSQAYINASYLVEDYTQPILDQTVEDQPAADYVKEQALNACKNLFAVEKKFNEMGLSLTAEELAAAQATTESYWSSYQTMYESIGVAKSSYHRATALYQSKSLKLFNAIYGPEGTDPVADSDVEKFFLENYESFQYFSKSLSKTAEGSTTSTAMTEDEVADVKEAFEAYVKDLEDGQTIKEVADAFKKAEELESDPLQETVSIVKEDATSLPEDILDALKELKPGEAAAVMLESSSTSSAGTYYLIYKRDIEDEVDTLSEDDTRQAVLSYMKSEEYSDMLKEYQDTLTFTLNDAALDKYSPWILTSN